MVTGTDSEPGTAAGKYVEGGDGLDQQGRGREGHAGGGGPEANAGGAGGEVAEGGVRLQHLVLRAAAGRSLQQMVRHPNGVDAAVVGCSYDVVQMLGKPRRPVGPRVVGD